MAVRPMCTVKAGSLNDDDASACVHGDDFIVETKIHVEHKGKHQSSGNVWSWSGH